jgi:asparagine synthetase B (glutamine-hydrolysing)
MLGGGLDSPSVAAVAASQHVHKTDRFTRFRSASGYNGAARSGWVVDESEGVAAVAALHRM